MEFQSRHIGLSADDVQAMLGQIGLSSIDELIEKVVPQDILDQSPMALPDAVSERHALAALKAMGDKNVVMKSMIGQGYYGTFTPPVIQRNVLENPAWYTAYTPYQPEISQGRLEVLFNFQTMVSELTALPIANASMLDEATAAAEAMAMCHRIARGKKQRFLVAQHCFAQTLDVVNTRAEPLAIEVAFVDDSQPSNVTFSDNDFALLLQSPDSHGVLRDHRELIAKAHQHGLMVIMATDLLALTLVTPPGEIGVDVAVGSAQRFGVPMGCGGPHAAFFATTDKHKRSIPGRLVGQSVDCFGQPAYRLALQTREQHIRREKATSNICTAQALLAIVATFYASYHGPEGLAGIAGGIRARALYSKQKLADAGHKVEPGEIFDTFVVAAAASDVITQAEAQGINLRCVDDNRVGISIDETCDDSDIVTLLQVFCISVNEQEVADYLAPAPADSRTTDFMSQAAFHRY
ncbi:MAG: aminomethyl-transferring glycine dehydrogenase subunit GcvPA, partial [Pseudomonadota bacterium]